VGKYGFAFLIVICLLLISKPGECTGLYGGAEIDDESQRFFYLGVQTEGKYFLQVFAGDLYYDFKDNGKIIDAELKWITPAVGIKLEGPVTLTLAAGPTFRNKKEERDPKTEKDTESGGFYQLGLFRWRENHNLEFLASYTNLDNFYWSRLRGRKRVKGSFFAGMEIFGMDNQDVDAWGVGPLLEYQMKKTAITFKTGYKHTSTYNGGFYTGLEFYSSF